MEIQKWIILLPLPVGGTKITEWWLILLLFFGGFALLMSMGVPVAFSFLFLNVVGSFAFMGGPQGVKQLSLSIYSTLANFTITPIPLFILMGEIIFQSGIAFNALNVLDKFFGKIPGRPSILSVAASTFFSGFTGSAISNTALLGSILIPEMKKKGYGKPFIIGPIIGSGGLAMMMLTLPFFMPIIHQYQINPIWFGIMMLIALDIGFISPPSVFYSSYLRVSLLKILQCQIFIKGQSPPFCAI